jgi:hypothetical protein
MYLLISRDWCWSPGPKVRVTVSKIIKTHLRPLFLQLGDGVGQCRGIDQAGGQIQLAADNRKRDVSDAMRLRPCCNTSFGQRLPLYRKEYDQTRLDLAVMPIDSGSDVTTDINQ